MGLKIEVLMRTWDVGSPNCVMLALREVNHIVWIYDDSPPLSWRDGGVRTRRTSTTLYISDRRLSSYLPSQDADNTIKVFS